MSTFIFVHATNGCLVGDTMVDCPRDLRKHPKGIPIKDLVGKSFWTYSWDKAANTLRLSKVSKVWCTGRKDVWRVKLTAYPIGKNKVGYKKGGTNKGKYLPPTELVGTYNHPVLLADGTWKPLGELNAGDSLKSLYRIDTDRGKLRWSNDHPTVQNMVCGYVVKHPHVYWGLKDPISEQQFICKSVHGKRPPGCEVHHIDENSHNHVPSNLEWKDASKHKSEHTSKRNLRGEAGWQVSGVHNRGMLGKRHTTKAKKRIGKASLAHHQARRQTVNHKVVSTEYIGSQLVYDMTVEGTHTFVANGVFVHNSGKTTLAWSLIKRAGGIKNFQGGLTYTHSNLLLIGKYHGVATGGMDGVHPYDHVYKIMEKAQTRFPKETLVFGEGMVTPGVERCRTYGKIFDEVFFIHLMTPVEDCIKNVEKRRKERGDTRPFDPTNLRHKAKSAEYWSAGIENDGLNVKRLTYEQAQRMAFKLVRAVEPVTERAQRRFF